MKIAVIGTGVAGNVIAHHLQHQHDVHVFEAGSHIGGHAHTHDIELGGRYWSIDTGFIVYNELTYPHFTAMLKSLGVATQPSHMSFSVRCDRTGLEYNGNTLNSLFAQRSNLVRPAFWRMVTGILRFNREAPVLLADDGDSQITLGRYLSQHRYSREFIDWYIVPMGAAIWSTDPVRMLDFPARSFVRFFHNHGMLSVNERPQWRTVSGGSREYVRQLTRGFTDRIRLNCPVQRIQRNDDHVRIDSAACSGERFDQVFIACHSDQALELLADPSALEVETLGAIPYQASDLLLHTDTRMLPRRPLARAAWNYHLANESPSGAPGTAAKLTYDMNVLQGLQGPERFCVSLNRSDDIDPAKVLRHLRYEHPLYTPAGLAAQGRHAEVNGVQRTYFCGAYWRYGFHEDGIASALAALDHFETRNSTKVPRRWHQVTEQPAAIDQPLGDQMGHPGFALQLAPHLQQP
jgi:hypothetical protein